MRMMLLILLSCFFLPQPAVAANTSAPGKEEKKEEKIITGDFSTLKHTSTVRIEQIIDHRTMTTTDGKIIRLVGIDYPLPIESAASVLMVQARERLQELMPKGTEVMLYQTKKEAGRTDRLSNVLAHLVTKNKDPAKQRWVNGTLIADGLAWVYTDTQIPEMASQLYALEGKARSDKLGLWSAAMPYPVLTPETAAQGLGQFRIVEGTVNRAATSKNDLYLNFGSDWKKDFTVKIEPDIRKILSHRGIDSLQLGGDTVRVRGWIKEWNGPFMTLDAPERLEIVKDVPAQQPPEEPAPEEEPEPAGQPNP